MPCPCRVPEYTARADRHRYYFTKTQDDLTYDEQRREEEEGKVKEDDEEGPGRSKGAGGGR